MSSDKNANDNNKKKTIRYWPLVVFGIIILIPLLLIILARANFTLKIKGIGAVQKEMGSPNYFKFTREFKSAKI